MLSNAGRNLLLFFLSFLNEAFFVFTYYTVIMTDDDDGDVGMESTMNNQLAIIVELLSQSNRRLITQIYPHQPSTSSYKIMKNMIMNLWVNIQR
jgi:hypothetical protein